MDHANTKIEYSSAASQPLSVTYRGHSERLFKRDFAGDFLDKYPDLNLIDYGFVYNRDMNLIRDDANWSFSRNKYN